MKLYPDDWKVRLTSGLVSMVCIGAALLLLPGVIKSLWLLMLTLVVASIVGNLLGLLVCRLLFRPSSGGPLEKEKK